MTLNSRFLLNLQTFFSQSYDDSKLPFFCVEKRMFS